MQADIPAIIVPLANEEAHFEAFIAALRTTLDRLNTGVVYLIVDTVSTDNTYTLCQQLSVTDPRFVTVFAPENKNVVDAYVKGYKVAYQNGHNLMIEMDAGLSHDPAAIPAFLRALQEGNECAFGSRFINGGSMIGSPLKRRLLSKIGTLLSKLLLGTRLNDMTSGYQGFHRHIVEKIIEYPLQSKAHFYQTEIRYLLRNRKTIEIPIHYRAPSPSVSKGAIKNAINTLFYYFWLRITKQSAKL
jgi:dolichol-phosphate mannosyltransferase